MVQGVGFEPTNAYAIGSSVDLYMSKPAIENML
jgi:hypothetical protein